MTRSDRTLTAGAIAVVTIGVLLRLVAFLIGRPLWLDEAMLSLNVATRSYGDLARPLDYDQVAPVPFLWLVKLATDVGGVNELALRSIPLLAGITAVAVLWSVSRELLGRRDGLVAVAVLALNLRLVYYAVEVKQYAVDLMATVILLGLLASLLHAPDSRRRWLRLQLGGMACLLASQPAVFVLAGVVAALLVHMREAGSPYAARRLATAVGLWVITFGATFVLWYRGAAANPYLARFWEGSFAGNVPQISHLWMRVSVFLAALPILVVRRRYTLVALLCVPFLAIGTAAFLRLYPVELRLLLFTAPLAALGYAVTTGALIDLAPRRLRTPACIGLVALLTARQLSLSTTYLPDKSNREDSLPLIELIQSRRDGEPTYVNAFGLPAWVFYTTDWQAPDTARLRWIAEIASSGGAAFANAPARVTPIHHSGDDLLYEDAGGIDVIGLPAGMEYRNALHGYVRASPDPGWAENEIRRLRTVSRPYAYIFLSHYARVQSAELLAAVQRAGGVVVEAVERRGAAVYRVCLPPVSVSTGPSNERLETASIHECGGGQRATVTE